MNTAIKNPTIRKIRNRGWTSWTRLIGASSSYASTRRSYSLTGVSREQPRPYAR